MTKGEKEDVLYHKQCQDRQSPQSVVSRGALYDRPIQIEGELGLVSLSVSGRSVCRWINSGLVGRADGQEKQRGKGGKFFHSILWRIARLPQCSMFLRRLQDRIKSGGRLSTGLTPAALCATLDIPILLG